MPTPLGGGQWPGSQVGGPRILQCGPGSISLGEAATPSEVGWGGWSVPAPTAHAVGKAPSGRVAGGSSAHTTRWGTVARVPSGGPKNSSMWSGQHFSGRSCYPLRGRMGGLVGSSTHSSRCGKGPISIEHTSQVTTALDWNPGWSNSIDADTLRADCTLGNDITRVPLSHRQREHDHQHRLSRSGQTVIGFQAQGLRSGEDGYTPPASCNQQ